MKLDSGLIQRGARYLRYRFTPRILVLLYHRVIKLRSDPQLLSVTPQHFAEHLEVLRHYAKPMSLKELTSALQEDKLPRRGVVITFDDGYLDNLQYAKPLLERYDIPATVFITAGQLDRKSEFWWDELERLLLQPTRLPSTLSLTIDGKNCEWDISPATEYTTEEHEQYRSWHIEQPGDPTQRHTLYRSIYQVFHSMYETDRRPIIEKLQKWSSADSVARASHRTLTADEVVILAKDGLIEVGAHTMTHPVLASLPVSRQQEEITQSKACLEGLLSQPVDSFAYPHGSYTEETISIVKDAGFKYACSSDTDAVWRRADPLKVPRAVVRDWDGDEFTQWIHGWFGR